MGFLELLLIILVLMWAVGGVAFPTVGGLLNILLVVVLIVLIVRVLREL